MLYTVHSTDDVQCITIGLCVESVIVLYYDLASHLHTVPLSQTPMIVLHRKTIIIIIVIIIIIRYEVSINNGL